MFEEETLISSWTVVGEIASRRVEFALDQLHIFYKDDNNIDKMKEDMVLVYLLSKIAPNVVRVNSKMTE